MTAGAQSRKGKKMSVVSSEALSLSSESLPSSTKKKLKLSEQIKTANVPSSTTVSLIHTPPLSPTASKPKRKSLRALVEAAKSKQVSNGSLEETKPPSVVLPSGSAPFVEDPLSSRTTVHTGTRTNPDKDKSASKTKVSKTKKAVQSLSKSKDTSSSPLPTANESSSRPRIRDDLLVDNMGEIVDLNVNKMLLKSGSGHQASITLKDVKATLGRANTTSRFSRSSILSQIQTVDDLSSKPIRPGTSLSPVPLPTGTLEDVDSCKSVSDQPPSTSSQHKEIQSVKRKSSKSKKIPLISLQPDDSPQPQLTSLAAPLLSGHLSAQVSQAKSLPHTVSMKDGLTQGHHVTGLPTVSPSLAQIASPHLFPRAPQTLPTRVETLRADNMLTMEEKLQLGVRKPNTADNGTEGWQWYYKKYIDVKKGGIGGLSMLLAGYCVLSYIWSYPHIKRDRWRKYH
uniref:'ATP synthase subunit f, mitochondrial' n=1 Tax=Dicentrarchus labrax TaxID=13489 RepID=E6ZHU4_DICLA|nr:ATP synthase subunit f, mitochondrial [Dicentrarchus labrax]